MFTAWATEIDHVLNARFGGHPSALIATQVSDPVATYYTRAAISLDRAHWDAPLLQGSVEAFMEALGGEVRPDADAEAAFMAVRDRYSRRVSVARRRTGPPLLPAER